MTRGRWWWLALAVAGCGGTTDPGESSDAVGGTGDVPPVTGGRVNDAGGTGASNVAGDGSALAGAGAGGSGHGTTGGEVATQGGRGGAPVQVEGGAAGAPSSSGIWSDTSTELIVIEHLEFHWPQYSSSTSCRRYLRGDLAADALAAWADAELVEIEYQLTADGCWDEGAYVVDADGSRAWYLAYDSCTYSEGTFVGIESSLLDVLPVDAGTPCSVCGTDEDCNYGTCQDGICEGGGACGDGIVNGRTETCDDGGTEAGDGCDPWCNKEPRCGDGVRDRGEECEDGNLTDGDGCDASCHVEPLALSCGNGVVDDWEQCDGAGENGDCTAACVLEAATCGDGFVQSGEWCDDGNLTDGDGCDASCRREATGCGDGVVDADEECDDGNLLSHDGCSSGCTEETPRWTLLDDDGTRSSASASLVFEPPRDRTLLLGSGLLSSFHAGAWGTINVAGELPSVGAAVYDLARDRVVVVANDGTFESIDGEWVEVTAQIPGSSGALAYDAKRGKTVHFGGLAESTVQTSEYDGQAWTPVEVTSGPSPRSGPAMTFDAARGQIVLFGGAGSEPLADTWIFDGAAWSQVETPTSPPGRQRGALAYDPVRERVVLFGGYGDVVLADTWEFDGTTWTETHPENGPSPRDMPAAVHDPTLRGLLVFGTCPYTTYTEPCADTLWLYRWESDGADEVCDNGSDDDEDGAIDCADPDCETLRCAGGRCALGACRASAAE